MNPTERKLLELLTTKLSLLYNKQISFLTQYKTYLLSDSYYENNVINKSHGQSNKTANQIKKILYIYVRC